MRRIREKIGTDIITTVKGIGYLFHITEFITILINKSDGWESSISNIPAILSLLLTTIFLILIKMKDRN